MALAQAPQREGGPRPLLLNQGSVGVVSAIEFSPDSRFLHVAGLDKAIHTWNLLELKPDEFHPTYVRSLRWEISRGYQGKFDAMAVSSDGQWIAAGGTSARNNGDVGLWETGTGRMATPSVLPLTRTAEPVNGHTATVSGMDFSPDGKKLVTIDKTGAIWVWDRATGIGVPVQAPSLKLFEFRLPIVFIDNSHFAAPISNGTTQLAVFDASGMAPVKTLSAVRPLPIGAMARQRSGTNWASADESGEIQVWTGFTNPEPVQRLASKQPGAPVSLSFLGMDWLVAIRHRTSARPTALLELWNWRSGELLDSIEVGRFDDCRAVAASPNGRWLAYCAPDTDEIRLIRLPPIGQGKLPAVQTHLRLSGRGKPIWEAQFGGTGLKFRFADRRQAVANAPTPTDAVRGFDLEELQMLDDAGLKEVEQPGTLRHQDADCGSWTLQRQRMKRDAQGVDQLDNSGFERRVNLLQNQQLRGTITLDPDFQGPLRSHCWIASPGAAEPYAIALGTEDQNGIYIYSLPGPDQPARLLRYFRDHVGAVTSLSVSADRRLLMSSSLDQTVKLWSLDQLNTAPDMFRNRPAWGADFVIDQGQLVARNVLPVGIAARRGIREGDTIQSIIFVDYDGKPPRRLTVAADMLQALMTREIYKEVHLIWAPNGPPGGRRIVPAWEPIATYFVDRHDEWVLFTPEGVFDASAAEGPVLLGWQYNRGRGFDPEVIEAGELIKELQKPDQLKQMLLGANPIPVQLNVDTASAGRPEIKILAPKLTDPATPADQPIPFAARIEYPPQTDPATLLHVVYVNSQSVPVIPGIVEPMPNRPGWKQQTITAQIQPTLPLNSIRVSTATRDEPDKLYREAVSWTEARPMNKPGRYQLHLISISCQEYSRSGFFPPLKKTKADGDAIRDEFLRQAGSYFDIGQIWRLDDTKTAVRRTEIQRQLSAVMKELKDVSSNDLLVIFLSGHGHAAQGRYRFVPSTPAFTSDAQVLADGVCMSDFDDICALGCRTIFLVDTCRAGDIAESLNRMFDEARQKSVLVVSATSQRQKAEELKSGPLTVFTSYLVSGLRGVADGHANTDRLGPQDQVVQFSELVGYVEEQVPLYTARRQRPCIFNRQRSFQLEFDLCAAGEKAE
ncbi:MAG: caspase family protein [Planctomycetes bacterium]|nr:caspase family protein [Planctomycetota bacterium]